MAPGCFLLENLENIISSICLMIGGRVDIVSLDALENARIEGSTGKK